LIPLNNSTIINLFLPEFLTNRIKLTAAPFVTGQQLIQQQLVYSNLNSTTLPFFIFIFIPYFNPGYPADITF